MVAGVLVSLNGGLMGGGYEKFLVVSVFTRSMISMRYSNSFSVAPTREMSRFICLVLSQL